MSVKDQQRSYSENFVYTITHNVSLDEVHACYGDPLDVQKTPSEIIGCQKSENLENITANFLKMHQTPPPPLV